MWENVEKCGKMINRCGKMWENVEKCLKMWKNVGKCEKMWKMWKNVGKCGKMWKNVEKCGKMWKNVIFIFYKTSYLNEEVNRTEPSPSVRFPWSANPGKD